MLLQAADPEQAARDLFTTIVVLSTLALMAGVFVWNLVAGARRQRRGFTVSRRVPFPSEALVLDASTAVTWPGYTSLPARVGLKNVVRAGNLAFDREWIWVGYSSRVAPFFADSAWIPRSSVIAVAAYASHLNLMTRMHFGTIDGAFDGVAFYTNAKDQLFAAMYSKGWPVEMPGQDRSTPSRVIAPPLEPPFAADGLTGQPRIHR